MGQRRAFSSTIWRVRKGARHSRNSDLSRPKNSRKDRRYGYNPCDELVSAMDFRCDERLRDGHYVYRRTRGGGLARTPQRSRDGAGGWPVYAAAGAAPYGGWFLPAADFWAQRSAG